MDTRFQHELDGLKEHLLQMTGLAERAISNAIKALIKGDSNLAQRTIAQNEKINQVEIVIDELCLILLLVFFGCKYYYGFYERHCPGASQGNPVRYFHPADYRNRHRGYVG